MPADDGLHEDEQLPAGLRRSAVHDPGLTRVLHPNGFSYLDDSGAAVADQATLQRIRQLAIPPAWTDVWISPDPLGHIQAMGTDARGRRQYRYHQQWRAWRDGEKFGHMLRFAAALPGLRTVTGSHLARPGLDRDRVCACALRVTELGLFRIGSERYAREDHTYGAASLERRHVTIEGGAAVFDYVAKESKHRTVRISDPLAVGTLRDLLAAPSGVPQLFAFAGPAGWEPLTTGKLTGYLRDHAGHEFTVKEFRTWNATLLTGLALSGAEPTASLQARRRATADAVRHAAQWLGDTVTVARHSYVDPAVLEIYETSGSLGPVPSAPAELPADAAAEHEILTVLTDYHKNA